MAFPVYDYRTDVRNVLVTPQIRSRFLKVDPGPMPEGHTHDLGHEVFLVLDGEIEFEIDGDRQTLGPGQMCVALVDQIHAVRAAGSEPATMYLSVTPHIQPTHTMWDGQGARRPHRFVGPGSYDTTVDRSVSTDDVVDRYAELIDETSVAAQAASDVRAELAASLKRAMADGDETEITRARNALWDSVFAVYQLTAGMADVWNDLAARSVEAEE